MNKKVFPHNHSDNLEEVLELMPQFEYFSETSSIFQQLDDPSRLRILWLLCHCEECVINIAASVEMSTAAVSHHLRTLKAHNLVSSKRSGKEVYYKIANNTKANLIHKMIDDMFEITCPNHTHPEHIHD